MDGPELPHHDERQEAPTERITATRSPLWIGEMEDMEVVSFKITLLALEVCTGSLLGSSDPAAA